MGKRQLFEARASAAALFGELPRRLRPARGEWATTARADAGINPALGRAAP